MYLLEDTEEARLMRENVCRLLSSEDKENISIAIQLIGAGGLHNDFKPSILQNICLVIEVIGQCTCYIRGTKKKPIPNVTQSDYLRIMQSDYFYMVFGEIEVEVNFGANESYSAYDKVLRRCSDLFLRSSLDCMHLKFTDFTNVKKEVAYELRKNFRHLKLKFLDRTIKVYRKQK